MVIPFGRNKSVAKITENFGEDAKYWLKYVVFDIVYLQGPSAVEIIQKHILIRIGWLEIVINFTYVKKLIRQ